jgi:hypothetical protein
MNGIRYGVMVAGAALLTLTESAHAQSNLEPAPVEDAAPGAVEETAQHDADLSAPTEAVNPDDDAYANQLNAQQQLQQTFRLRRTIDGEVVETIEQTVTLPRSGPYRPTEAGLSPRQRVLEIFDRAALTRTEAFEEAKLHFTIADADRDGQMTQDEFAALADVWREESAQGAADGGEETREQYAQASFAETGAGGQDANRPTAALTKFTLMAGDEATVSERDYIRRAMTEFDAMDADKDRILRNEELVRFRAVQRGETADM